MPSTAETYRDAAREHLAQAQRLFEQAGRSEATYFEAHYFFGLSVECLLRAYLRRVSAEFDPRHNLVDLSKHSRFFDIVPNEQAGYFSTAFIVLNQRWRANHRYFSEAQINDHMNEIKAEFGVKGQRWKNLCRTISVYSYDIPNLGEAKWNR